MTDTAEIIDATINHGVYDLASLAEVKAPDTRESAGARLLVRIQDEANGVDERALLDCVREFSGDLEDFGVNDLSDDLRDSMSEWADSCVQIYTHQCWAEFADLCLWEEDLSDLGPVDGDDLTKTVAMRAQYIVAERLLGIMLAQRALALAEANPLPEDDEDE